MDSTFPRHIAILGSTGSIGTQALDVVRAHRDKFRVEMISALLNAELLIAQAIEFDVPTVIISDPRFFGKVNDALAPRGVRVLTGPDAMEEYLSTDKSVTMVLAAMVGFSGLRPTLSAIRAGKTIALANKETLVAAGHIVMGTARECGVEIIPVDSEHSAIFQCLRGEERSPIEQILLTASGGPFLHTPKDELAGVKAAAALRHPRWDMGQKVTIDSSTLMNKGFEMIEARWLFNLSSEQIKVVVHPQSIIHSMVRFCDSSTIAQMGVPDMRLPIQFALSYPERFSLGIDRFDFARLGSLNFEDPDMDRFPCLGLAFEAIARGGSAACAMNAANEVAVAAFLAGGIGFYDIPRIIRNVMDSHSYIENPSLEDIFSTDRECRAMATEMIG